MSASWLVSVEGHSYGPYTDAQMAGFAAEGRLAPQSMIARVGEISFRAAEHEPALAPLFASTVSDPAAASVQAESGPRPAGTFGKSKDEGPKSGELAHIIVMVDMKSGSISAVEEALYRLGHACPIFPQAWILRTQQSANTVRNELIQTLGKLDAIFVVDATNDRAAWFNFGPEPEARIRRTWTRTLEMQSKARAAV